MIKTPSGKMENLNDELLLEYRFDYAQAKPNRFAKQDKTLGKRVVILDEDVAQIFTTPESVNKVLRALITSIPQLADGETA
ncbi:hypothetical protein S7335_4233 [Synechococcus sp. PCC 7335]|uniref:hypothetical protein n=1 Tax=Synechococcus sp. (strain ATCC 29403 / PCC 7335) TaxID=91464 RepID=UPI00017EE485|nr:hypothetical protein [Synechococcus sp. PCC 7335]EDX86528.1 hypothetical protein S7335_4233 [Synechococcus sp. PCC 7335]